MQPTQRNDSHNVTRGKKERKKVNGTDSDVAAKRQIPHDSNDDGRKNITRKSKKKINFGKAAVK
jgi:hypothetical protein